MKAIIFTGYEQSVGLERVGGAYRIATILRQQGWNVEVIDFFYRWNFEQLKELIKSRKDINWIGFSATWINYSTEEVQNKMKLFLEHIKTNYTDIITLAGGQNPSTDFDIYKNIDWIIDGFGEIATLEVLRYIFSNGPIPKYMKINNSRYVDANTFYPAWPVSDLSVEYEPRDFITQNETLAIEMSRGCKFSCAFCNFPVLGVKEDTTRDLKGLQLELQKNYDKYGITNYQISDETLNDRDEKLIKIGNTVKQLSFTPNFNAFIRADILFSRPQQNQLLIDAGVWGHYYGIETLNFETGKLVGKGMNPDKIKQGLLDTEQYFNKHLGKYRGTCSLIYGLPKETKETILDALEWFNTAWSNQNAIAFPLNLNLTGKKSKLDLTYQQYGYRIVGEEKREELFNRHNFFSHDLVVWENDDMNLYDAINLSTQLFDTFPGYSDNWRLWSLMSVADTLDEALQIRSKNSGIWKEKVDSLVERAQKIKDEYIQKKLSL